MLNQGNKQGADRIYTVIALILVILTSVSFGLFIDVLWESQHLSDDIESAVFYTGVLSSIVLVLVLFFNEKHRQSKHRELIDTINSQIAEVKFNNIDEAKNLKVLSLWTDSIVIDGNKQIVFHKDSVNVEAVCITKKQILVAAMQYGAPTLFVSDDVEPYKSGMDRIWHNVNSTCFTDCKRIRDIAHANGTTVVVGKDKQGNGAIFVSKDNVNFEPVFGEFAKEVYGFWEVRTEGSIFVARGTSVINCKDINYVSHNGLDWQLT